MLKYNYSGVTWLRRELQGPRSMSRR